MVTRAESFNVANSATLSGDLGWVEYVGTGWETSSSMAAQLGTGRAVARCTALMDSDDQAVDAVINNLVRGTSTSVDCGPVARQPDASTQTYYAALLRQDALGYTLILRKTVGGTDTDLQTPVTVTPTFPCTVRLEVQGSTQRAYLNGTLLLSATDTSIPTGPAFGLRGFRSIASGTVQVDSMSARDMLATGAVTLSAPGALSAGGTAVRAVAAALVAPATLTVDATRDAPGAAQLGAPASLSVDGTRTASAATQLTAPAALAAGGTRDTTATVPLAAPAALAVSPTRATAGTVTLAAPGALLAAPAGGGATASGAASLTAPAALTVSGTRTTSGSAALAAPAALTVDGTRSSAAAVTLTAPAQLLAGALRTALVAVGLPAPASLTAGATRTSTSTILLAAPAAVSAAAGRSSSATVQLAAPASLTAGPSSSLAPAWHLTIRATLRARTRTAQLVRSAAGTVRASLRRTDLQPTRDLHATLSRRSP